MSQTVKEKQAAAKQTFVFQASLANEYPAKQDEECGARIREPDSQRKTSGCEADICFSGITSERISCEAG